MAIVVFAGTAIALVAFSASCDPAIWGPKPTSAPASSESAPASAASLAPTLMVLGSSEPPPGPSAPITVAPPQALSVTGAGRQLSRVTSDPVDEVMPEISPNGNVLLFEAQVYDKQHINLIQATIVGVDPNTGANRQLFTSPAAKSRMPAWPSDGSSFVYTSDSAGRFALVRSLAAQPNAAITVLTNNDAAPNPGHPSFSPDGKRIAFDTEIRGRSQIAIIGVDGSRLTILGEGGFPAWSPDGKHIAFMREANGFNQIFIINPETGTNLVQVTNDESHNKNPAWSPNNRYIIFNSNRGSARFPGKSISNLYITKPDGTGLVQLTDGDAFSFAPCWGKDGWIYFSSNKGGNYDIWRLQPAGEIASGGGTSAHH